MKPKKIFFYTLGCKVNQYETQAIREQFLKLGYIEADLSEADIVIINTCTVTSRSDTKSLKSIRRAVKNSPFHSKIVVTGCLAEKDKGKIKKIDGVDLVIENKFKPLVSKIVEERIEIERIKEEEIPDLKITHFKGHTRAFLKVQDGCNHKCSYCKVSLVRGKARSRSIGEILEEAKCLINNGYKEIVLTGVCLGAYGVDLSSHIGIIDVVRKISDIEGNFRIRLSSIEPNYVTKELLDFIIQNNKICQHLHFPLQSGEDRILELMNRPYKIGKVLDMVNYIRAKNPLFSFSTDIIVGFPTENESSIENTVRMLKIIQPLRTHIFKFSPRKGTVANSLENNVTSHNKKRWHKEILKISDQISLKFRSKFLGRILRILVEKGKNANIAGYTDNYIYINTNTNHSKLNEFVKIKVNKVTKDATFGILSL